MNWYESDVIATELGESFVVARAAYIVQGFGDEAINSFGERILDRWIKWAGHPKSLFYLTTTARQFRELGSRMLARIRRELRNADAVGCFFAIKDSPDFDAGSVAFEVRLGTKKAMGTSNAVHFALPHTYPDAIGVDTAVEEFCNFVKDVPFRHASAGFGYNMVRGREWEQEAMPQIMAAGRRYLALDVRDRVLERRLLNEVKSPGWLTFLGPEVLALVGGAPALATLPAEVTRTQVGEGVVLRAGVRPPIGDTNRRATDLGPLRAVARLLRPVRVKQWDMADMFGIDADVANEWFARLDE